MVEHTSQNFLVLKQRLWDINFSPDKGLGAILKTGPNPLGGRLTSTTIVNLFFPEAGVFCALPKYRLFLIGHFPFLRVVIEPLLKLRNITSVKIKAGKTFLDDAVPVQHGQGKVAALLAGTFAYLPLRFHPGEVAVEFGPADLLAGIPDAVETGLIQRTHRRVAALVEAA